MYSLSDMFDPLIFETINFRRKPETTQGHIYS